MQGMKSNEIQNNETLKRVFCEFRAWISLQLLVLNLGKILCELVKTKHSQFLYAYGVYGYDSVTTSSFVSHDYVPTYSLFFLLGKCENYQHFQCSNLGCIEASAIHQEDDLGTKM